MDFPEIIHKTITVIEATEDIVEFNDIWAVEGDILQDYNDEDHDIELEKQEGSNSKRFTYLGTAKVGEIYYVSYNKTSLPTN